jgi:hypothetical protein
LRRPARALLSHASARQAAWRPGAGGIGDLQQGQSKKGVEVSCCSNCGCSEVPEEAAFCQLCGSPVQPTSKIAVPVSPRPSGERPFWSSRLNLLVLGSLGLLLVVATVAWLIAGRTVGSTSADAPATPAATSTVFSGAGTKVTTEFGLEAGLAVFEMVYNGSGPISIWLETADGAKVELLCYGQEVFVGSRAVVIDTSGQYVLDVSAEGGWTATVERPDADSPVSTSPFTGYRSEAAGPLHLSAGAATFHMSHTGGGLFAVWLYGLDGRRVDLLANQVGPFDGSKTVTIPEDGDFVLDINTNDVWSVTIGP